VAFDFKGRLRMCHAASITMTTSRAAAAAWLINMVDSNNDTYTVEVGRLRRSGFRLLPSNTLPFSTSDDRPEARLNVPTGTDGLQKQSSRNTSCEDGFS
jgi:hypothetical protein